MQAETETVYQLDWPWTDEHLDMINYHAHRLGKVLIETLGVVIEYEIKEGKDERTDTN